MELSEKHKVEQNYLLQKKKCRIFYSKNKNIQETLNRDGLLDKIFGDGDFVYEEIEN